MHGRNGGNLISGSDGHDDESDPSGAGFVVRRQRVIVTHFASLPDRPSSIADTHVSDQIAAPRQTITTSPRKYRAWLIRWEWATAAAAVERPVMAVLRPQTSPEQVRRIVEILYASQQYEPDEMLVTIRPRGHNPYPAQFVTVAMTLPDGSTARVPWLGHIVCGHNPYLIAHQARVWSPPDRPGEIAWDDEPARPA